MGRLQDAEQHLVRDRVAAEAVADVAALAHDAQHGLALGVVVAGRGGLLGCLDVLGGPVGGIGVRGRGPGQGFGDRLGLGGGLRRGAPFERLLHRGGGFGGRLHDRFRDRGRLLLPRYEHGLGGLSRPGGGCRGLDHRLGRLGRGLGHRLRRLLLAHGFRTYCFRARGFRDLGCGHGHRDRRGVLGDRDRRRAPARRPGLRRARPRRPRPAGVRLRRRAAPRAARPARERARRAPPRRRPVRLPVRRPRARRPASRPGPRGRPAPTATGPAGAGTTGSAATGSGGAGTATGSGACCWACGCWASGCSASCCGPGDWGAAAAWTGAGEGGGRSEGALDRDELAHRLRLSGLRRSLLGDELVHEQGGLRDGPARGLCRLFGGLRLNGRNLRPDREVLRDDRFCRGHCGVE